MTRRIITAVLGLGAMLFVGWLAAGFIPTEQAVVADPPAAQPLSVDVIVLEQVTSHESQHIYTGRLAPRRSSIVSFEVSGKVNKLHVDDGEDVESGMLLASIDTRRLDVKRRQLIAQRDQAQAVLDELENGTRQEDIDAGQARVGERQAQLDRQKFQLKRREDLFRRGVISTDEYEDVKYGVEASEKNLTAAKAELAELIAGPRLEQIAAQQALVASLNESITSVDIDLADAQLRAPYSGTILNRMIDEGTVVTAGEPVFEIIESHQLEVRVGLPAKIAGQINAGTKFDVEIRGRRMSATARALLPQVNPETRTRTAILQLQQSADAKVVAEELARVFVTETKDVSGFWLPLSSLTQAGRGLWSCFAVVETNGKHETERRLVEVLHTEEKRVLVRGTLNNGDLVVSEGSHRITAGHHVIPRVENSTATESN